MGPFRNFVRNTQDAYASCRADILRASPQNLSLVLTGDSDVMTEREDRKGYVDSQHHHRAEGQQSSLCTSHPELTGLLALMFCVLIKAAAVNGCSLSCPLVTRYLNTCKGRGRSSVKIWYSCLPLWVLLFSKKVLFFFFFFHGESKVGTLFALMISQMGSDVLT